jgi:integrase/recombinase XerD
MEFQVDGFILYLATEKGLSTAYQLSVRQTLDKLLEWTAKQEQKSWRDLGTDELSSFLSHLRRAELDASSLRIALVHLKIFFRFLQKRNHIEIDPAEPLLPPKDSRQTPRNTECRDGRTTTWVDRSGKKLGKRDLALLELFYASGLRLSEMCRARLEFLDLEDHFLRITGKGNKTRIVPGWRKSSCCFEALPR